MSRPSLVTAPAYNVAAVLSRPRHLQTLRLTSTYTSIRQCRACSLEPPNGRLCVATLRSNLHQYIGAVLACMSCPKNTRRRPRSNLHQHIGQYLSIRAAQMDRRTSRRHCSLVKLQQPAGMNRRPDYRSNSYGIVYYPLRSTSTFIGDSQVASSGQLKTRGLQT